MDFWLLMRYESYISQGFKTKAEHLMQCFLALYGDTTIRVDAKHDSNIASLRRLSSTT